jgi:isoamylase
MFNAGADAAPFRVPSVSDGAHWHLAVDTGGESPRDVFAPGEEPLFDSAQPCLVAARSASILLRRTGSPSAAR